jgi:hypothetical protein
VPNTGSLTFSQGLKEEKAHGGHGVVGPGGGPAPSRTVPLQALHGKHVTFQWQIRDRQTVYTYVYTPRDVPMADCANRARQTRDRQTRKPCTSTYTFTPRDVSNDRLCKPCMANTLVTCLWQTVQTVLDKNLRDVYNGRLCKLFMANTPSRSCTSTRGRLCMANTPPRSRGTLGKPCMVNTPSCSPRSATCIELKHPLKRLLRRAVRTLCGHPTARTNERVSVRLLSECITHVSPHHSSHPQT